jgi:peptide/nickel transport system permease protein
MATTIEVPAVSQEPVLQEGPSGLSRWTHNLWRFCRRKPLGAIGGLIIFLMLFCAVFVDTAAISWAGERVGIDIPVKPLLAPSGYNDQDIHNVNQDPSWSHPMGTDNLGRDIFSRILYGARISAVIGLSAVLIAAVISLVVGTISGYFSGAADMFAQRIVDVFLAIPAIVLLLFAITVFASRAGPYKIMFWIIIIVGFLLAVGSIRIIRGAAISTANNQYVDAARSLGATHMRIVRSHIVPNVIPVVIVVASIQIGTAILAEATLSFLGYGIPNPFPSWGAMLNLTGSSQFRAYPLQALWPGVAIAITVWGFNMFGDAIRDVLDPRLRGGR